MVEKGFDPFGVGRGEKRFGYLGVVDNLAARVEMPVGVVNGSSKGPTFTVTGGLYPTEYDGVEAAVRLYQRIDPGALTGRLVILPVVNMPCLQFRTPWFNLTQSISPMDGLNINRFFPGDPEGTVTRAVAHRLFHDIILRSDYHVDLRGGDLNESHLVHTIYARIGQEIDRTCEEMAKAVGFRYVLPGTPDIGHTGKGALIYEAVTRGVPSIITESGLGYRTQPLEEYVMLHVEGVENLLRHLRMIPGEPRRPKDQRFLDMTWNRVRAPVAGIFQAAADQGDIVKEGQQLGRITGLDGSLLSTVSSPVEGVVHCMFPRRLVYPGDELYTILKIGEPTGW